MSLKPRAATKSGTYKLGILSASLFAVLAVGCNKPVPPPAPKKAPPPAVQVAPEPAPAAPVVVQEVAPEDPAAIAALEQQVLSVFKTKYPEITSSGIKMLKTLGVPLFQIAVGDRFLYTNSQVDYLMAGGDVWVGLGSNIVNLTGKPAEPVNTVEIYRALPFDKAIKTVYGDGSRQIAVFTDPDCPFCQQLDWMLDANKDNLNLTVYTFPYPLSDLHPKAMEKSTALMCSADPAKSWSGWMTTVANKVQEAAKTEAKIDSEAIWAEWKAANLAGSPATCPEAESALLLFKDLGTTLGYNQTPVVLFQNGMPWMGLLTRDELEKSLQYAIANPNGPAPAGQASAAAPAGAPAVQVSVPAPVAGPSPAAPATTTTVQVQTPVAGPVAPSAPTTVQVHTPAHPANAPAAPTTVTVKPGAPASAPVPPAK